jgi:hypothetical protein
MQPSENLTQVEDLFLQTKARELRNKVKKLDKINQTAQQIKKGELNPNGTQV